VTTTLDRLDAVLHARQSATAEASYTKSLYEGGAPKIGAKLREEADELARAVADEAEDRVVSEAADVLFHVMVALRSRGRTIDDVLRELERRSAKSGHEEKRGRGV
jgi:phosphoribosyl-ATP pyrophosphohydrolase/phosphoribosyl-AMP cyclohydrolase